MVINATVEKLEGGFLVTKEGQRSVITLNDILNQYTMALKRLLEDAETETKFVFKIELEKDKV